MNTNCHANTPPLLSRSKNKSSHRVALCAFMMWTIIPSAAQTMGPATLEVDTENIVSYATDIFDPSKFATDPNAATTVTTARNFGFVMAVGDIVAVNGMPAKGTLVVRQQAVILNPNPNPGQAIADIVRTAVSDYLLEIQQPDGTYAGNIHTLGMSGGTAPVGAPFGGNLVVAGGTGAFLGARGQMTTVLLPGGPAPRTASVTEDPAKRRINGGGRVRFTVELIQVVQPEIVASVNSLAIYHADFSNVTAEKPARSGEILIARAAGLGPTRPGVNLGQPFPMDELQEISSPVEVTVAGRQAEVLNKVGWPGTTKLYRVEFRIPEGTPAGMVAVQLSAAWITGPSVRVSVR